MNKRRLGMTALVLLGFVAGGLLQPFHWTAGFAADDCRTFAETGKQVCGRFLQYWANNGSLAQQGLPLTNEFNEVSDLNGQSYDVQYFERAVFERHPENQAPYDVLLSQLGTFRLTAKYAGIDPSDTGNTPTSVPNQPTALPPSGEHYSFSGDGTGNSNSAHILGGDYKADWATHDNAGYGCFVGLAFRSVDTSLPRYDLIANQLVDKFKFVSGTINLNNVKAADYYIQANSGCPWTVVVYK